MHYLRHRECEIPWEKKTQSNYVADIESEKEFGLIDRDVTRVDHIHNASLSDVKVLPVIKGVEATIKLKPDAKPVFCRGRKVRLAMEAQIKFELAKIQAHGTNRSKRCLECLINRVAKEERRIFSALLRLQSSRKL